MDFLEKILISPSPTLFLDRDGVINRRLPGEYVRNWAEFEWLPSVPEAIAALNKLFTRTIVVTNQQGIGKGLMTEKDLQSVHQQMQMDLQRVGGHFDLILYCPDLRSKPNNCRKPNPAMALEAQRQFPEIHFEHSLMVGDSVSDLRFGKNLGMATVLITTNPEEIQKLDALEASGESKLADLRCGRLKELLERISLHR